LGKRWSDSDLSEQEFEAARRVVERLNDEARPGIQRFTLVREAIATACEAGELVAALRPKDGGSMQECPREWWNTDRIDQRFHRCLMSPHDPFGPGIDGDGYCQIFLTRDSLDRFLTAQPFAPVATAHDGHLSPYLKFMLAISKKLGISPEHQPKAEQLRAEIRSAWTGPKPLSERQVDMMATFLREPESQLGRALKKDGK
jgi:hypothetical protein